MLKRSLPLIGCAALLSSCGGGGGVPATPVVPTSTYRSNQVGDSWTYALSINLGKLGSGKGTLRHGLSTDTFNGQPAIRDSNSLQVLLKSGLTTSSGYSVISMQGALVATTVNGTLYQVTGNTFNTGSSIDGSTNSSGVITLSNGQTLTETYKVVGTELCTTPSGTYKTWVVKQTALDSTGILDEFTLWIAPETGSYVKIRDVTTTLIGPAYSYTATLTSMSGPRVRTPGPKWSAELQSATRPRL